VTATAEPCPRCNEPLDDHPAKHCEGANCDWKRCGDVYVDRRGHSIKGPAGAK